MQADEPIQPVRIEPLPYQKAVFDYLKREEPELWDWFSSHKVRAEYTDAVRLDLLKSTYRLDREAYESLYALADRATQQLGLEVPVTFYQAQNNTQMNAGVAFIPGEAHITFSGSVLQTLNDTELFAVVAHELGHVALWENWDNDYLIADQILSAMCVDPSAAEVHLATARLNVLFMEVYCDRCALTLTGDASATISMLVKIETGLKDVSADSYIRQAEEIFAKGSKTANGNGGPEEPGGGGGTDRLTHPECYIRARAVDLWRAQADHADRVIERMVRGPLALDSLDLIGQQQVARMTRALVDELIAPDWFRSDTVLAHARTLFEDYEEKPTNGHTTERDIPGDLNNAIRECDPQLRDYFCYLVLDFVAADRDLEDAPRAAGILFSQRYGFGDRFAEILAKELGLRKKQLETLTQKAQSILDQAEQSGGDA